MKTLSNNSANPDINLANIINLIDVINTSLEQKILFSIDLNKENKEEENKKDEAKKEKQSWGTWIDVGDWGFDGWSGDETSSFSAWDGDIGGWDF
jgi:hypothetical protein